MRTLNLALLLAAVAAAPVLLIVARPPAAPSDEPDFRTILMHTDSTPRYSKSAHDLTPPSPERLKELAARLTPDEARVILRKGTEPAFCGNLLDNKKNGVYLCRLCSLPLFASDAKFDSGTGWPSFFKPVDPDHVATERDDAHGMVRTEILCARCRGHLGHVFDDAPHTPTGLRFCLNSASLEFHEHGTELPPAARPVPTETAYFAGGCFWGVEHYFQQGPGVIDAVSGYMQGHVDHPTYKQVCGDDSGHAEAVKVVFDPKRISYRRLLEAFFVMHDPTQLNRQGPDVGTQYRSGIYFTSENQAKEARAFIQEQHESGRYKGRRIVTEVEKAETFWPAEEYHQDYVVKTGRPCHIADPWKK